MKQTYAVQERLNDLLPTCNISLKKMISRAFNVLESQVNEERTSIYDRIEESWSCFRVSSSLIIDGIEANLEKMVFVLKTEGFPINEALVKLISKDIRITGWNPVRFYEIKYKDNIYFFLCVKETNGSLAINMTNDKKE